MGWTVVTIWECQLKPKEREKTLRELEYLLNREYLAQFKEKTKIVPYPSETREEEDNFSMVAEEGLSYGNKK